VKRFRLRSVLATAALLIIAVIAWWYFAPTNIGGSTRYVVTSGISMEPRFHTGDLAIVRPASTYRVGEIVAYHSTLLHVTVLHRIIAIHNGRYVFKGDNNDFIDPVYPTRSELLGKLWLHVPRGGVFLDAFHTPVVAAVLCALLGVVLLAGAGEKRRRRKRRRKGASRSSRIGISIVDSPRHKDTPRPFNFGALLAASAVAAAVFAVLGAFGYSRADTRPAAKLTPYSQQVTFGYSARVTPGPVYPGHAIKTGDPIFLNLVHSLRVRIGYRVSGALPGTVKGTETVVLKLAGPGGWSRDYVLTPATHFSASATSTNVTLDLPDLTRLMTRISSLTGGLDSFSIAVGPQVNVTGAVAGHPITTSFAPSLTLTPQAGQLLVGGASQSGASAGSAGSGTSTDAFTRTENGAVSSPGTAPARITVYGLSLGVDTLRWIALIGLLLSVGVAAYAYLRKRGEPFEESVRIQAQYGHLIVPIIAGEDLGWPPVDVPNIKALVRLAESGQRLILHNRSGDVDTYMVNDEGTVYRYQVRASKIVWGEWTDAPLPAPDAVVAAPDAANAA
jgi:signal peptidase I